MQHAKWQSESMIGVSELKWKKKRRASSFQCDHNEMADGMKYKKEALTSALLIADLSSITATGDGVDNSKMAICSA
jgi:hypothetical protein